jgi:ribosomal protein S27AE
MTKWKFKSCPRCGGDILIDHDLDSWYAQCLQCGYRKEFAPVRPYREPVAAGKGMNDSLPFSED